MEGVRSLSAHCLGCIAVSFWWVQLAWVDALVPPRPKLYLSICLQNYRVPFSLTCALGFFHACQIGISCPPVMGPDRLVGVGREDPLPPPSLTIKSGSTSSLVTQKFHKKNTKIILIELFNLVTSIFCFSLPWHSTIIFF